MPVDRILPLALDGAGVRGLSLLMILQQLMATVNPESPPKPCDYFDMIGGTSTCGLISCWVGKLQGRFERAVKQILVDRGFDKNVLKESPNASSKVPPTSFFHCHRALRRGVRRWRARNEQPRLYTLDAGPGCVGRPATGLAPGFDRHRSAHTEAGARRLGNIGYPKRARNRDGKTAEQFRRDKSSVDGEGRYYRFNINGGLEDIGLEESKKMKEMAVATGRYITSQEVLRQLKACASTMSE